ncbi:hypothetical protein [Cohaesibacter intestini]|uniref:hypothetical protein n=1 Tax=Cohaesibacter intestini TaxID=2211145 RepID=UPI000DEA4DE5|nr:hypothetical protein [Cohaesibacter intestini]
MTYALSNKQISALLAASRLDLDAAGGAEAVSEITGYRAQSLDRMARPKEVQDPSRQQSMSLLILAEIILFSEGRSNNGVKRLADLAGMIAIPKPDGCQVGRGHAAVCAVTDEFAGLVKALSEALADDGKVSAEEIIEKDLCGKLQALARVCMTLEARYTARVEEGE